MAALRRSALTLVALAFLGPGLSWAGPLRPLPLRRATYSETFTFIGDLDDGTYVQLTLSLTNLGPGSLKGLCRALVFPPQGPAFRASARVGHDEVNFGAGPPERLGVGSCSATADDLATVATVKLEGGTVELAFAQAPLKHSPHDATFEVGGDRYTSDVLIYRAGVKATLTLPDGKARTVDGRGYVDHSRTTIPPKNLARHFIRFRGLRGDKGLLLLGRETWQGDFAPLWACLGSEDCQDYRSFHLDRQGSGRDSTFRIEVKGPEGSLLLRSGTLLYRDAPVEDLGLLGHLVAPLTGSPVTYVYRGTASRGDETIEGILEVELLDD